MTAPDKIFCDDKDGNEWGIWFNETDGNTDVVYIRKEALLEWLQLLYEEYSERSKTGEMVHQIAGTYLDVINHIKEM